MAGSVIGCVPYLNARPLTRWLELAAAEHPEYELRYRVPSQLAKQMLAGRYACGMLSSVVLARNPHLSFVPDVAIASNGPVASVKLFTSTPVSQIRSVALDTSSLTSVALARVLLARRYGVTPTFHDAAPDLSTMLQQADAAVIIGDPCLLTDPMGCDQIDLGECWTEWTGLPFVWALWIGRPEFLTEPLIALLQQARDWGIEHLPQIIAEEQGSRSELAHLVEYYLKHNVSHRLSGRYIEGFARFRQELTELGLA